MGDLKLFGYNQDGELEVLTISEPGMDLEIINPFDKIKELESRIEKLEKKINESHLGN